MNPAIFEIGKFTRLSVIWLCLIFGLVWAACWLTGIFLPAVLEHSVKTEGIAWVTETLKALVPIVAVAVFIPINAMFMVLVERRALALFTVRKGPNRVGPDGLLQTAADAVKLLFKEDITPTGADVLMFTLAPIIFFAPSIIGVIPLLAAASGNHDLFAVTSLPTGIFYIIAVSSIPVVGIVMGAWASNNKYSLVGGLRSAAQAISYEIPLVLSLITICLLSGTLNLVEIVRKQEGGLLNWNLLGGGGLVHAFQSGHVDAIVSAVLLALSCFTLFWIYVTAACAEVNRIPFDLPEAESELVSGYNTEYSGIKFAIFFLAEFTNLFVVCSIAAVMFLGGWHSPIPALPGLVIPGLMDVPFDQAGISVPSPWGELPLIDLNTLAGTFWIILKAYGLVFFAVLVRGTLPRFRIDQLMDFGWKRLIPLSLILLILVTWLRELV